jgi:hypothetical protein
LAGNVLYYLKQSCFSLQAGERGGIVLLKSVSVAQARQRTEGNLCVALNLVESSAAWPA